jgi:UDP-GlcNAc:undecaprenyl-phosphate/decaprenyl-phosphate GlcNAc-1-phosphate transferase
MYAALVLGLVSFAICYVLTPLCRDLFIQLDIVDHPDTVRKFHGHPIPRIGGIPIVLSYALTVGLAVLIASRRGYLHVQHRELLWFLLPATALVFLTGLIDDLIGLKPWQKLLGQFIATVLAVGLGARIQLFTGHSVSAAFTVIFSVAWILGCTNGFNLIDGLDGLASGVGLFATLTVLLAALLQHNIGLAVATLPLAACLIAFLRYNFPPASIFLGDCGSLTIGFMLGCFSLIWSQKSATLLGMAAPMMALAVPLIDVSLAIGRRFLRSKPIFQPDRSHIHHRLVDLGLKPRDAALVLYGVCGIAAVLSLLHSVLSYQFRGVIVVLFCILTLYGIKRLGYTEFKVARLLLSKRAILKTVHDEIYLHELSALLSAAGTPASCWEVVSTACSDLNCDSVQMILDGQQFMQGSDPGPNGQSWDVTLPLGARGHLRVTRPDRADPPILMMSVLNSLQKGIYAKPPTPAQELDLNRGIEPEYSRAAEATTLLRGRVSELIHRDNGLIVRLPVIRMNHQDVSVPDEIDQI